MSRTKKITFLDFESEKVTLHANGFNSINGKMNGLKAFLNILNILNKTRF